MKPILALKCPKGMTREAFLARLRFPLLATPKIDGIRCQTGEVLPGQSADDLCWPRTRSGKNVPNLYVRDKIVRECPPWLDGELTAGNFQSSSSAIMSHMGMPDFIYRVFDCCIHQGHPGLLTYEDRIVLLTMLHLPSFCKKVIPESLKTLDELLDYEKSVLKEGYEGVMLRPPDSPYVVGTSDNRATLKRPYLIALKTFEDGEAVIVGMTEEMHNENAPKLNEMGNKQRANKQEHLFGKGTMGSLQVQDLVSKKTFSVGTGFTAAQRETIWKRDADYIGAIIKYKWQAHGTVDKPRIPVFLGFRDQCDMSHD